MSDVQLNGKRVAFLVAPEGVEQVELTAPWQAVSDAGGQPVLISTDAGEVQAFNHLDKGDTFPVDVRVEDASPSEYVALVLPGGVANPDLLRTVPEAIAFVQQFAASTRPIAVICHGPWTLVEADVVRGRRLTSWPSLATDLRNAGAEWVDEQLVVDTGGPGPLLSSREPGDLEAFCAAVVEHAARAAQRVEA